MSKRKLNFEGKPSRILENRPLISIIIPIHDPDINRFKNLIESISAEDVENDIEVIVIDDMTTSKKGYRLKDIYEILEEFGKSLCIKYVKNPMFIGNGLSKNVGVYHSTGEWLMFMNMEDTIISGKLTKLKEILLNSDETYSVFSNYLEFDYKFPDFPVRMVSNDDMNSLDGKLFNKDNLWRAFGLEFSSSEFHEKALMNNVIIIHKLLQKSPLFTTIPCIGKSIKHEGKMYFNGYRFMIDNFEDFVKANFDIYCGYYIDTDFDPKYCFDQIMKTIIHMYFVSQYTKYENRYDDTISKVCIDTIIKFKKLFKISNVQIYDYISIHLKNVYQSIRGKIIDNEGVFIEIESFLQWLDNIHEDIEVSFSIENLFQRIEG